MNKKGQFGLLALAIIVVIGFAILGISFFSPAFKWYVIGIGILIGTFIYVLPAAFKGNLTKNKIAVILILLSVGVVFIFLANTGILQSQFPGASTLSVSTASLSSQNSFFSGQAWLVTFRNGGLNQHYYGTITPSDIQAVTSGNQEPTKSFIFEVNTDNADCRYSLTGSSNTPIYKNVRFKEYNCVTNNPETAQAQAGSGATVLWTGGQAVPFRCFVVYSSERANVGGISQPNINVDYTTTLTIQGQSPVSKTINSLSGSGQGALGNDAYIIWQGNLVSGQSCDSASGSGVTINNYLSANDNNRWKIISSGQYQNYRTAILQAPSSTSASGLTSYTNNLNSMTSNLLVDQSGVFNNARIEGSSLIVPLSSPIQFPVSTLYIKATTLGIYTATPQVQIQSATSQCFTTGTNGNIEVKLKNLGGETGTFNVFADCDNPFTSTVNRQVSINAGQTKTVNLPISATATQQTNANCVVNAQGPGTSDTETIQACVNPQLTCTTPYPQRFCSTSQGQDAVAQCSQSGGNTNIIEICTTGNYCEDGTCKVGAGSVTPGNTGNITVQQQCTSLAEENPFLGYTYQEASSTSCGLNPLCIIGISDPKVTVVASCEAKFIPYYTLAGIILVLGITAIVLLRPRRRRRR